jgi:hypothetical protein
LLPIHHWAHNFTVEPDDIDYLVNLLLEEETPLTSQQLALVLVENRLEREKAVLEERYRDVLMYNPADSYEVGQKLIFPVLGYSTATVVGQRQGNNVEYDDFNVIKVEFEEEETVREFASGFNYKHELSQGDDDVAGAMLGADSVSSEQILEFAGDDIIATLESHLLETDTLEYVARYWFPRDLILEPNAGHLNLTDAVLDVMGGGPLSTESILDQIGGISDAPHGLQVFSMNYTLNKDQRFAEVGSTDEVLWYLSRMMPSDLPEISQKLLYPPLDYDRGVLTQEMLALEEEICDELSPLTAVKNVNETSITLLYPHRRFGTLPLNAGVRHIFPSARKAKHIWITLVDEQDGEEYTGWVIPEQRFVYGLGALYSKYRLPIGAYVTIRKSGESDRILISFHTYKAHTEWVRLMQARDKQLQFEDKRRSIGAEYDDLMIIGIDDLEAMDAFVDLARQQNKHLASLLRIVIPELGRSTPQGTTHVKTIYSAINVLRRYPPGPILATLRADPDFENVGGHYWKLSD